MTDDTENHDEFIYDLKNLLSLDYAAIDAYETAIEKLTNQTYKNKLEEFKKDHQNHVKNISNYLKKKNEDVPTGAGLKRILTQGKVVLANLAGDIAILKAMRSNEVDTTEAYENINNYSHLLPEIKKSLLDGYEDEKRHLAWIEKELAEAK